ncbi:unnamed protein product, partial [Didymodactylos carnosus]
SENSVNELDLLLETSNFPGVFYDLELANNEKTLKDVVKMVVDGISRECCNSLPLGSDKTCVMRDLLWKGFAGDIVEATDKVDPYVKISEEAANTCIEIFVKLLNKPLKRILNNLPSVKRSQVKSLGPYCWLLYRALRKNKTSDIPIAYAGLALESEEMANYMKPEVKFTSFTLGYKEREHAENYKRVFEGVYKQSVLTIEGGIVIFKKVTSRD